MLGQENSIMAGKNSRVRRNDVMDGKTVSKEVNSVLGQEKLNSEGGEQRGVPCCGGVQSAWESKSGAWRRENNAGRSIFYFTSSTVSGIHILYSLTSIL